MKDNFLTIKNHHELASFLGTNYKVLSKNIYELPNKYKYRQFEIPKKNGGIRVIKSPNKEIKRLQVILKDILYEIYEPKPASHGFEKNRSIVSNAQKHLDKEYVFNIDLENFFGSIHFTRVRNFFKSKPFLFNHSVATILAQICCIDKVLPQGAPTSPILANMICWKMDSKLAYLAKNNNCTYTRYADDITFSFSCNKNRLPANILQVSNSKVVLGNRLQTIIQESGFSINHDKTRLSHKHQRLEVTGLTVNEFPNVKRAYIREINSILHAWEKYGYKATEQHFNFKYGNCHQASGRPKSLLRVIHGKLAFLASVKSPRDHVYRKLVDKFNRLPKPDINLSLPYIEETNSEKKAMEALWVFESCYDDLSVQNEDERLRVAQGTGFQFSNLGIITCAHVVSHNNEVLEEIEVFKSDRTNTRYQVIVQYIDYHRDIAICQLKNPEPMAPAITIDEEFNKIQQREEVILLGFPAYNIGQSPTVVDAKISSIYPQSGVPKFEISSQIREGNSGGPIINKLGKVVGVALEGAQKDGGNNGCILISEIHKLIISK